MVTDYSIGVKRPPVSTSIAPHIFHGKVLFIIGITISLSTNSYIIIHIHDGISDVQHRLHKHHCTGSGIENGFWLFQQSISLCLKHYWWYGILTSIPIKGPTFQSRGPLSRRLVFDPKEQPSYWTVHFLSFTPFRYQESRITSLMVHAT